MLSTVLDAVNFAALPWDDIGQGILVLLAGLGVRSPLVAMQASLERLGDGLEEVRGRLLRLEAMHELRRVANGHAPAVVA